MKLGCGCHSDLLRTGREELLGRESMRQIVEALPADSRYILKMNDKDTLKTSMEWVEKAAERETA